MYFFAGNEPPILMNIMAVSLSNIHYKKFLYAFLFMLAAIPGYAHQDYDDYDVMVRLAPGVSVTTIELRYDLDFQEEIIPNEVYLLEVDDPGELSGTLQNMKSDSDLEWSDYNYFGETPEATRQTLAVLDTTPTVSEYKDQTAFQRIRGPEAHAINQGQGIIVAVIDTGVDYNHPSLANNILRDGSNNVVGFDFVDDDNDPMDDADGTDDDNDGVADEGAGHGTHVAGIIALIAPQAKILPVRVLNTEGFGNFRAIYKGVKFAVDNGATVVNLSFGMPTRSEVVKDAIERIAFDSTIDASVIASAGNDGQKIDHFPAADGGNIISATATDPNDVKAAFSNFNNWVDLTAPGVGIYSTFLNGQFATWDGTSMSAPFITGQVALIRSYFQQTGGIQPSEGKIQDIVQYGTDYIYSINQPFKKTLGSGRVNLLNSVLLAHKDELADPLQVKRARYDLGKEKLSLRIVRKSNDATIPVLTVQGLGTMIYGSQRNRYKFKFKIATPPTQVTILSSDGQILTVYVAAQ